MGRSKNLGPTWYVLDHGLYWQWKHEKIGAENQVGLGFAFNQKLHRK